MRPVNIEVPQSSSGPLTATHEFKPEPTLNILIPMAGEGRRFKEAGYILPKPLIDVRGKPMIQRVVENIALSGHYIFVIRPDHVCDFLMTTFPRSSFVISEKLTEGAACSVLLAKEHINNDNPLLIANADQLVEWSGERFIEAMNKRGVDGGVLTFAANHPKWSYVRTDEHGLVVEVAEKKVISNVATVGIYWYRKGSEYVRYAERMIAKNFRVNGEFYVAPVFNEYLDDGKRVATYPCDRMIGLGTPEDLAAYLR